MKMNRLMPCVLALALSGGALVGCAQEDAQPMPDTGPTAEQTSADESTPAQDENKEADEASVEETTPVHEHTWVSEYQLQTIPAVTETVHHDAETETVMENHTICNVCYEVIDDSIEAHQAETGHVGVSTNVPVPVEKETVAAWDETIVKTPEQTKLVSNSEKCSTCGEVRQLEQTKVIDPADAAQAVADTEGGAGAGTAN